MEGDFVFLLFIGIGGRHTKLEAVDCAPEMSVIEYIDGSRIIFKTTNIQGFLTHAYRPLVVETVLDIKEVGVVEKADRPCFGNDTLAEKVGDVVADIAANQKVKVLSVKAIVAVPAGLVKVIKRRVVGILPLVGA